MAETKKKPTKTLADVLKAKKAAEAKKATPKAKK